jgi:hypothetical protein
MQDALGYDVGILKLVEILDNHQELISAQPANRVQTSHTVSQSARRSAPDQIADFVVHLVVDSFEVIEVEHENCEATGLPLRSTEGPLESILQQRALGQIRQ